jgi:formate dehydrogenase subunit delta
MSEIHTTPSERLVMMANQIAKNFAAQGEERAVHKTAEHIKAFWDPRMRRKIDEHLEAGGAGLEPYALAALEQLKMRETAAAAPAETPARPVDAPVSPQSPSSQGGDTGNDHRWRFKLPGFSRSSH